MEAAHAAAFAALCQRAFRTGDPVAAAVLLGVERNDFAAGLLDNPLPDAHVGPFKVALVEVGVPEGTQHLAEEHVAQMRLLKNQQRELFHVQNTAHQHELVAQLLRDCTVSQPSTATPSLCRDPQAAVQAATRFMGVHVGNIGAHSFIHGLRATLERQLTTPAACRKTKSKIGARLEPMSHVDVLLHRGRDLDVVNQVEVVDAAPGVHGDLERITQAISMCEAIDLVSQDREPARHLYEMLVGALRTLESQPSPLLLAGFFLKLLAAEGVGPQVTQCVSCAATDGLEHFDFLAGGVQCGSCATGARLEDGVISAMQDILGGRLLKALATPESRITRATTSIAMRMMEHHVERRLKSSSMFGLH